MKCTIRRNGKEIGEFSLEDTQTKVIYGALREGDEFRYEGTEEWKPISALPPSADHVDSRGLLQTPGFWIFIGVWVVAMFGLPYLLMLFQVVWGMIHPDLRP